MTEVSSSVVRDLQPTVLRAALDALPDPCVILDPVRDPNGTIVDFTWVHANRAACEYNGLELTGLLGRRLCELLPSHRLTGLFDDYVRVIEQQLTLAVTDREFPAELRNGAFRCFDMHAAEAAGSLVLTWKDCTERQEHAAQLTESERRFRLFAESTSDILLETDREGVVRWVAPSISRVLGWSAEEWIGRRPVDQVEPSDLDALLAHRPDDWTGFQDSETFECRYLTATGERRWMAATANPIRDLDGQVSGYVVGLRDIQDEVTARRAADALSAGNAVLARAEDESQLLFEMCAAVADRAGYLFAWYGRAIKDDAKTVRPVAWSEAHADYLTSVEVSWGEGPLGDGPTGNCIRLGEPRIVDDFLADPTYTPWVEAATGRGFRSSASLPVYVDGVIDGAFMVYAGEVDAFDNGAKSVLLDLATQLGYGLGRLRDSERLAAALDERLLLGAAIDQAAEAVVVTDLDATIRYANPAALRLSGYSADEVIGQNPRIFQSGYHSRAFYAQVWAQLLSGRSWRGVLVNRKKNGELYEEEATITPVFDASGRRVAYVGVKHDLSRERSLEAVVSRDRSDRDAVLEVIGTLRSTDTLATSAHALCRAMCRFDGIDSAKVLLLQTDGSVVPVAMEGPAPADQAVGSPVAVQHVDELLAMSDRGAWWIDLTDPDGPAALNPAATANLRALGFTATAFAPIRWEGQVVGALVVASMSPSAVETMSHRLGVLAEIGSFAGMVMGPQAGADSAAEAIRATLRDVIDQRRFRTVFEPVVELSTGETVGYEALTRFDDGDAPDSRFIAAQAVGMGGELEEVCATAALAASDGLPSGAWISINFSPGAIVEGRAAAVVAGTRRNVVIEITEHNAIENYAAVRHAIAECGDVRVAVDDAGAGFASLRHILELQPDIIKLDLALVRDIDSDPARQALAAGLRHFGALTGTTLIAEGVETEAQARTVRDLGVDLAQGYLFHHHRA